MFLQLGLQEFEEALKGGSLARGHAKIAWELMHFDNIFSEVWYKPNPVNPWPTPPPWPLPWPPPNWSIGPQLASSLLRNLGDPDPQPSKHLAEILSRETQLQAALSLRDKLRESVDQVDQLIDQLG